MSVFYSNKELDICITYGILDVHMELPGVLILIVFVLVCNKYQCPQVVGNNKPGWDSELANWSNWRLVEDNPWLTHLFAGSCPV